MSFQYLINKINGLAEEIASSLQASDQAVGLGLPRSARIPVLAALHRKLNVPTILLIDRNDKALLRLNEAALWAPETPCILFPEPNPLFYEKAPWGENTRRDRLTVLTKLAGYHLPTIKPNSSHPIIIAPARACMSLTIPRRDFLKYTRSLQLGQSMDLEKMVANWVMLGYERVNTVIAVGQFARRGGILDIWPPAMDQPARIEFFGDNIETLRTFDPATQRTVSRSDDQTQKRIWVGPARESIPITNSHYIPSGEEETLAEFYLPLIYPNPATILDYLPTGALVVLDDEETLMQTILDVEEQAVKLRLDAIQHGNLAENFPTPYMGYTEITENLNSHRLLRLGKSTEGVESFHTETAYSYHFEPNPRFGGRLKVLIEHLVELVGKGESAWIVSRQQSRIEELWKETQTTRAAIQKITSGNGQNTGDMRGEVYFISGSMSEGWVLKDKVSNTYHLYSDGEIFGIRPPEPRQHRLGLVEDPEASYTDLQAGDYVVHIDHGIGIFIGLVNRIIEGAEREYLCVEYADEAQLFVPVHQADRITRYIGPDKRNPTLSRLGSSEWKSIKSFVKEAVQEVAEDLLALYAKRSVISGHAFSDDTPWQQELEASFPYIETEDQIRVLEEVKKDMEKPRPMDRLICGDVGYGKTEVALRAAFKSVMDGKQVAILVPTTILAQQHYNTFHQRLSAFPIRVEMLSRFRTPQQQTQIVNQLKKGAIDILIGTHRLLSPDVEFKDLGLLIIDEEQRFGVTHKEKLKQMRTEVDVVTMTATPIPRTLYMALAGVRDISTINTPPEERLPVITHVGVYNPSLVRTAILRELERGGQVFFVHNRVQTIQAMRSHLEKLIPEAQIAIAHGQMAESELSERMQQFNDGKFDILLSTSIIESGLDIPNANTLIVDRADTFGLAQLYQLRGRVGRGAQRAYAYFFRHARKQPTIEGRQRLETIAENTQLGAGYSIAMRDLEIRGTGDILGTRQSGHVAAVGFHLYTKLLAEAVINLQKTTSLKLVDKLEKISQETSLPVNIDLPLDVNIPTTYVAEKNMRLRLYRRLANIRSLTELDAIKEEFQDRFGDLPEPVDNLLYHLKIKILAEKASLAMIIAENGQLALKFPEGTPPPFLSHLDGRVRVGKYSLWLPYSTIENWRAMLEEVLLQLKQATNERQPLHQ